MLAALATAPITLLPDRPVPPFGTGRPQQAPPVTAERPADLPSFDSVASLFEWEHDRAARYERLGEHQHYWNDPRIHNFGNTGWRGLLHALVVPVATHMIDRFAYDGTDARKLIHESEFTDADATVVDLCSGVGFSAARKGKVTCVDTSSEMLTINRLRRPDVKGWVVGNAEDWGEAESFDVATMMFGTHEMPGDARRRCIRNALRLAKHKFLLVDIWPGFEPNDMMLSGEPYVLDYLQNIDDDVDASMDPMQWTVTRVDVVEDHVRMWKFERLDWGI
jgi:SAM-dependent methyltransferase